MKDMFDYYDELVADNAVPVTPTEPLQNEMATDIVNSILARLDDLERMVTNARDNQPTCE